MRRLAFVLALVSVLVWSGCDRSDDDEPRLTEADVLGVVPPGWSLVDWALAPDGAYMTVVTDSPRELDIGTPRVASVYGRGDAGPVEIARVANVFGSIRLAEGAAAALMPDDAGDRSVTVLPTGKSKAGMARVLLRASGDVIFEQQGYDDLATITSRVPEDPLALIDIELPPPPADYERPLWRTGPWRVPAGSIPVGWTVTGAAWSPDERYVAVTSEPPDGLFAAQFSIYDTSGSGLREVWRAANDYTSMHEELVFKDINGDKAIEVVYEDSFGGTGWLNYSLQAVTVDSTVRPIEFVLPIQRSTTQSLEDLDGDGVYEAWAVDASWELEGWCHVCSPRASFVLAWDGAAYVDASPRFVQQITGRVGLSIQQPRPDATCMEQDQHLSNLVSWALAAYNTGSAQDYGAILSQIREYDVDERLRAKRDQIVNVLNGGEPHAPWGMEWARCEDTAGG